MDLFLESIKRTEFWIKLGIIALSAPIWIPVMKTFWKGIEEALADDGGLFGKGEVRAVARREPGLDPWLNVPRAGHRARMSPPRGQRSGGRPAHRRPGF